MYLNHFSNIMSDSYDKNLCLTDSNCNHFVGEEGIYKPKSYVEIRVYSSPAGVQSTRRAIIFIIPNKFNVQFMSHQDTGYSVQVSFIPSSHRVKPALANYPSLSFCRFFRDCRE